MTPFLWGGNQRVNGDDEQEDGEEDNEVWNEERDQMMSFRRQTERLKTSCGANGVCGRPSRGVVSLPRDQTAELLPGNKEIHHSAAGGSFISRGASEIYCYCR